MQEFVVDGEPYYSTEKAAFDDARDYYENRRKEIYLLHEMNSLSKLNSLFKGGYLTQLPVYNFSENEKGWLCECVLYGNKGTGTGKSKKEAKEKAAQQVIIELVKNDVLKVSDEVKAKLGAI